MGLGVGMGLCLRQLSPGEFIVVGTYHCSRSGIWGTSKRGYPNVKGVICMYSPGLIPLEKVQLLAFTMDMLFDYLKTL